MDEVYHVMWGGVGRSVWGKVFICGVGVKYKILNIS